MHHFMTKPWIVCCSTLTPFCQYVYATGKITTIVFRIFYFALLSWSLRIGNKSSVVMLESVEQKTNYKQKQTINEGYR